MRRLLALAIRVIPADWRDAVGRDLSDEGHGPAGACWQAVRIGGRLRVARGRDALMRIHRDSRLQRSHVMREFGRDFIFAVRGVVRRPAASLAVVLTLAIGIGANTAIYSVFNWVLFRPLPGASAPSRLVTIKFETPAHNGQFFVSYRDYLDLREGVPAFESLATSTPLAVDVAVPGAQDPARMDAELVSPNYFDLLGVAVAPGRGFSPDEERPLVATPPVVISRRLSQRLFQTGRAALGQPISINGHAFTVVGVAPATFQGRSLVVTADVWMPVGAHLLIVPTSGADLLTNRAKTLLNDAFGRLRPDATLQVAQQQASAVADRVPGFARRRPGPRSAIGPVLYPGIGQDAFARERLTRVFTVVMSAVGLLLLLACANAANLLLARALGRRREIAVCQAIGASRARIVRQQLAEGLVLSLAAGALGLALASLLTSLFDGMRLVTYLPAVERIAPDVRVVVFTLAISTVTGIIFASAPALATSRVDLTSSLKDGRTCSRGGRRLLRSTLATVQVAVSILLLVCAGLFVRTLTKIRSLDLGLKPDGVVSFSVNPPRQGYAPDRAQQYLRDIIERLRARPGITSVAFSWTTPYLPMISETGFVIEGDRVPHEATSNTVSRGFFETMGIPMLAGRDFTEAESLQSREGDGVAIVSVRLARELFPRGNAVGSRLVLEYPKGKAVRIVGIVGDVRGRHLTDDPEGLLYEAAGQFEPATWGVVHVRSSLPLADTVAMIRSAARELNPLLPPYDIGRFSATIDRVLAEQRLLARLGTVFALVATLLAAVGIYGMMACTVGDRTREFGIRLALGARERAVLRLAISSAVTVTSIGIAAGLAGAALASRAVASRLYGIAQFDPVAFVGACTLLVSVAFVASFVPALRATRVDPVRSLRVE